MARTPRDRPQTHPRAARLAALPLVVLALLQAQSSGYPQGSTAPTGDLAAVVVDYAAVPLPTSLSGGLSRVNMMRFEPGDAPHFSSRAFVGDLRRYLYVVDLATGTFVTYIDFQDVFAKFVNGSSYGTGFVAFAFDPDYQHNGKFYTVHTESPGGEGSEVPSNVSLPGLDLSGGYVPTGSIDPPTGSVVRHVVLIEWTDVALANAVFEGTAREVMRIGFNHGHHNVADMLFNPAAGPGDADYGNLYLSLGDGGGGRAADEGNAMPQQLDALPGKLLRITPDLDRRPGDWLAANGRYRIPSTGVDPNPFVGHADPAIKKEIFAYGFRNPQRMSWDVVSDTLFVADIGAHSWEELNIVRKGANYGYARREGPEQLFVGGTNHNKTGSQTMPPTDPPQPDALTVSGIPEPVEPTYPVAAYSHHDGDAIAGGFVYRGAAIPQLYGKYIFGDVSTARLFYVDFVDLLAADDGNPWTLAPIRELQVLFDHPDDTPDAGVVPVRLFDVIADHYVRRGAQTVTGARLPGADVGGHMTDALDIHGIPYGGGRADIRFAQDPQGELYILSKADGMIRKIVAAREGATATMLVSSPNPSDDDELVQLTATVTATAGPPTGVVEFFDDDVQVGTASLQDGVATLSARLAAGPRLLRARFVPASGVFLGSTAGRQHFVADPGGHALGVTVAGSGEGLVTSSPAGIACPATCIASFGSGSTVTLTAAPNSKSWFVGWSGACTGTGSCAVPMQAAASVSATFATGEPDLYSAVSAIPTVGSPGAALSVAETTSNGGSASAPNSTTRYLLSADTTRSAGDIVTGSRGIATLGAGASSPATPTLTIPATTPVGQYYLLACADDTGKAEESDEQNNCGASAGTFTVTRPDLVTTAVGAPPAHVAVGGAFTTSNTARNSGGYASVASTTRFYLSQDGIKSAGDVLLTGTHSVPTLSASASSSKSGIKLTVPKSTPLGMYLLLACADDLAKNAELSETNNCLAASTQLRVGRADLVIATTSNPPSEIAPGKSFSMVVTTHNQGTAASTSSSTRFYASADSQKDGSDVLLTGTVSVSGLVPGQTKSGSRTVTVPAALAVGTYQLLACADDTATNVELDEANNCLPAATPLQVKQADLIETAISNPPPTVTAGGSFTVTDTVVNNGAIGTNSTSTRYYLSLDTAKNAGDVLLTGARAVSSLNVGASSTGSKTVTVPSIAAGIYYLLACADDTNSAVESREDNNCVASNTTTTVP